MRVLIVDDDPHKVAIVQALLVERGVAVADILTAEHAAGARILLERVPVDVLLIDVLLPVRAGAVPRGEDSVELLRQIVDDGTTNAPRYILGMTASLDARATFDDEFKSLVIQVLHVAPGEAAWRESLNALLLLIERVESAEGSSDYDICVLNALRSPELEAVYSSWPLKLGAERLLRRNIVCRTGTVTLDGVERRIACSHLSQMGPVASAHAATALLAEFRPRVLLMTGICGGFSDHVQLGDVLVAEKSWDWQAGKWTDGGTLATASDQRDAAAELIAQARSAEAVLSTLHAEYGGTKPPVAPRLVVGPMVTGSSVVASLDIQKVFREQHRKMAGVDMECYGLYYAAENHAGAPVHAICVKAVSDLADRAKSDDFQMYCSYMSALVSLEVLKRFFAR
jgi:nucleoside phosphorylase/CheY-like chemotaxis protein